MMSTRPWLITKHRTFCRTTSIRSVHDIGTSNNLFLLEVPNKEPWCARWDAIVHKQSIMFIHIVATSKGKCFLGSFLYRLILPSVWPFWQAIVLPCPMKTEHCCHNGKQQYYSQTSPFFTSSHHSLSFEVAVNTKMVIHSNRISA